RAHGSGPSRRCGRGAGCDFNSEQHGAEDFADAGQGGSRPQDDGGAAVPVVHGAAGVAGVAFGYLFVRVASADRLARDDDIVVDAMGSEVSGAVASVAPVVDDKIFFDDLAHDPVSRVVIIDVITVAVT